MPVSGGPPDVTMCANIETPSTVHSLAPVPPIDRYIDPSTTRHDTSIIAPEHHAALLIAHDIDLALPASTPAEAETQPTTLTADPMHDHVMRALDALAAACAHATGIRHDVVRPLHATIHVVTPSGTLGRRIADARACAARAVAIMTTCGPVTLADGTQQPFDAYSADAQHLITESRIARLQQVARMLAVADDADQFAGRRHIAAFVAHAAAAKAAGEQPPQDYYVPVRADEAAAATPSETAAVAAALHPARGATRAMETLLPRSGHVAAATTPNAVQRTYRKYLACVTLQGGDKAVAAFANDGQALFAASPLAAAGKASDASKARLAESVGRLRRQLAVDAPPPPLPPRGDESHVCPVRLVHAHREFKDECPHCVDGTCTILETAALTADAPVILHDEPHPTAPRRGVARARHEAYPLTPDDDVTRATLVAKLLESRRIELVPADADPDDIVRHPTFVVTTNTYATPTEADAAFSVGPDAAVAAAHARADEVLTAAMADTPGNAGLKDPVRIARALAASAKDAKKRLVFDYGASGLNSGGVAWPFALPSAHELLSYVTPSGWIGSVDMANGFHQTRMHDGHRAHMAFRVDGVDYQPTRLMFGLRQGPAQFSLLSAEVVTTVTRRIRRDLGHAAASMIRVVAYIDDIFVFAPTLDLCRAAMRILTTYCADVNVALNERKVRVPSQCAPVLGFIVDTVAMTVTVPADKRFNTLAIVAVVRAAALRRKRVPRGLLRKLAGKLSYLLAVAPHAAAMMAPIWRATSHGASTRIGERPDMVASLDYFARLLADTARCTVRLVPSPSAPDALPRVGSYGDASGTIGFSATLGPVAIHGTWGTAAARTSIGALELYPNALIAALFGDLLSECMWQPMLDNLPDVFGLLKGSTDDIDAQPWLALALTPGLTGGPLTLAAWNPRHGNTCNDNASKTHDIDVVVKDILPRYVRE